MSAEAEARAAASANNVERRDVVVADSDYHSISVMTLFVYVAALFEIVIPKL